MNLSNPFTKSLFLFAFLIYAVTSIDAVDFEDLEETRVKVYGSEKDKKYRLDGFFVEWENWPRDNPTHNHFHFLWFANTTDYPKYKKNQIFPFYYDIESKIDKRKSTNYLALAGSSVDKNGEEFKYFFPFYFQKKNEERGLDSLTFFPLFHTSSIIKNGLESYDLILPGYIYNSSEDKNKKNKQTLSISPFHISSKKIKSENEESTFWFPIVPIYYSSENSIDKHNNYFWLIDTNFDKYQQLINRFWIIPFYFYKQADYTYIVPFYFHNTTTETGQSTNSWFGIIPPIYRSYSPNHSKFYLLNFYTSELNLKSSKNSFTMFFPFWFRSTNAAGYSETFIPFLFYNETNSDSSSHTNLLVLYDHKNDKEGDLSRLWIAPFFFYEKENYKYIVPFYFHNTTTETGQSADSWFGIIPPIYRSYSPNHSKFYFLNFYTSELNLQSSKDSFTMFFPFWFRSTNAAGYSETFIPFLYYNETYTDSSSHTNLLVLYDQKNDKKGDLFSLWIAPFFFYEKENYNYIIPFYFHNTTFATDEQSNSWFGILPPIYRSYSEKHSLFYLLNFYTSEKNIETTKDNFTMFFPFLFRSSNAAGYSETFLPFLYYNETIPNSSSHTNVLIFYDQEFDENGDLSRLWLAPICFYAKDDYFYFIPFYFRKNKKEENDFALEASFLYYNYESSEDSSKLIGIYYESESVTSEDKYYRNHIFPFYYSWLNRSNIPGPVESTPESGFLFLPFIYKNTTEDNRSFTNVLGFINYSEDDQDRIQTINVLPIRFYKRDSYNIWFPFSFKIGEEASDSDEGLHFGTFFYNRWNKEYDKMWILNYYSNEDKVNSYDTTVLFPVYNSWKREKSEGKLVFPLYLDLNLFNEESKVFDNYNINILGIATQSTKGIFQSDIQLDIGKKSKYYYLDTDISWLYYAFRISNRISTKYIQDLFPTKEDSELAKEEMSVLQSSNPSPRLVQKKEFTREDSYNFFGLNVLFGVFGYEAADTKRHIRLLPLAWLTYDTIADDNIYAGPLPLPFVWYTSADIEYRIIFPIYGFQKSEEAERQSYGLFLFLQEAVLEDSRIETSIVWPLVNFHSSDSKKGSRIIPIYWQRTTFSENETSDSTIVPLGLTYINRTVRTNGDESNNLFSPFVFRSKEIEKNKVQNSIFSPFALFYYRSEAIAEQENIGFYSPIIFLNSSYKSDENTKSNWFLPVPFLYHSKDANLESSNWNWLLIANYSSTKNLNTYSIFPFVNLSFSNGIDDNKTLKRNWLFPFFYSKSEELRKDNTVVNSYDFYSPIYISHQENGTETNIYPLLGYYSEIKPNQKYWNWMFLLSQNEEGNTSSFSIFPFYSRTKSDYDRLGHSSSKQWLAPIFYNKVITNKDGNSLEESFYSILYANEKSYDGKTQSPISNYTLFPIVLLSYSSSQGMEKWDWLFFIRSKVSNLESSFDILPIFHKSTKTIGSNKENSKNWLFPLYYYDKETDLKNSENQSYSFYSLIYNSINVTNSTAPEKNSSVSFIPILPVYYHSEKGNSEYSNFLYFIQWETTKQQLSYLIFFPFYYKNDESFSGRDEKYYHFIPLYFSKKYQDDYEALICGLYVDKTKNSSYYNLLFLAEHESMHENSALTFNFLFRSIHVRSAKEAFELSILYGFSEIEILPESTSANLLWIAHEKREKSLYQNILPIYYYNDTEKESTFWLTPLLYYVNKDEKSKLEHAVAGLVYYNNEDLITKKSLSNILLGIVYYKTVKPKERGYIGRGSLWGALWEYNTEEETNYSKFSILKILYSRRVDEDGVTNRILFFEF
ncbi:LA_1737 family protein [Leptospira sp. GIMC2001]|uniref:LA_1737 family protein n=1 Tax=Leptospira sp. GIMC2001 TaxID=1513297 RepID=UPI002349E2C7|nr:hypothetical protein [Leptospira sp. GIMC2001]WCL48828.1 hypothetical protein O4O04_16195 [Leptospira sp. GIMC2001]